ncbi:Transcription initiation Spt4 [Ascosphaera apis ARSEF 7405]|uniref:Transcription elongation factor SPT4 n=1 Tax=Ascosphaera apis ARSEF 7405 TaxID=392613 RepID=A0A167VRC6_9EURO|nr:Transcription initiation Spt4 [Ascosphaera apis ARSEF 7405]
MTTYYAAPGVQRKLRACMVCSIVQLHSKFVRDGCPNCEEFLGLRNNADGVAECCSQVFEGLLALSDPSTSWVAKYQRLDGYVPGTYAVKVTGILPQEIIAQMEDAGVRYIPRDGSSPEEDAQ